MCVGGTHAWVVVTIILSALCPCLFLQCIAAGSHIANHEAESIELRPYAVNLSKVVTKVRQALRLRTFVTKQHVFPQKVSEQTLTVYVLAMDIMAITDNNPCLSYAILRILW